MMSTGPNSKNTVLNYEDYKTLKAFNSEQVKQLSMSEKVLWF